MRSKFILLLFVVALSLGIVLGESELITPPAEEEVTSSAKPLRNDGYNNRDLWYHPWSSSSGKSGKSGSKSTSHPTLFPTLSPTLYPTMYPTLSPTYCGKSGKSGGGGKGGKSCSSSWSSSSWDWRGATKLFPPKKRTDPTPSDIDVSSWGEALGEDTDTKLSSWLKLTGGGDEAADEEEEDADIDTSSWAEAFGSGGDRDLEQDNSMLRRRINGGEQAVIAEQEP